MLNVIMKEGWIQNDGRRVLMDDRLLGHRPFSDLSFAQKNMLTTRFYLSKLTFSSSDFPSGSHSSGNWSCFGVEGGKKEETGVSLDHACQYT